MITKIKLADFRNFHSKVLEISPKITVIVGPNASGKTNILESLFLLSTGKSFKAKIEEEMIRYGQSITSITGNIGIASLEVKITTGENGWPKKKLLVNGVPKRMFDFAGNFKTVLFGPWDMDLVTQSPSLRRKFLDTVLSQVDREYRRSILSYEKGLRQRNKLLFRIREEGIARSQLVFWNQLLVKTGNYITEKRFEFIEFCNSNYPLSPIRCHLDYDRSVISEGRLEQYAEEEVAAATTLVGPHRDDFIFQAYSSQRIAYRNLAAYGSRGEQRMSVLWLKIAELNFIERETGERPTLLLDDIFSELDHEHRDTVMELTGKQQTVITTADKHFLTGLKVGDIINL